MANAVRGEIDLDLGERRQVMRPTFAALADLESATGEGLMAIARRFNARTYGVRDVVAVLRAGIAGGAADPSAVPSAEQLGIEVVRFGIHAAARQAAAFLAQAFDPGEDLDPEKNV